MNYTQNLHLPQWEASDRIHHDDFNDAFQKLDTAVKANSTAITALGTAAAGLGNCQIETQTYTGDGKYDQDHAPSLTFDHEPYFVVISGQDSKMLMVRGDSHALVRGLVDGFSTVTWDGSTITWYGNSAGYAMNTSGRTYVVVALCKK